MKPSPPSRWWFYVHYLVFLCPFVTLPSCPSSLSPSSHSKHLLIYFLSLWISLHFSIILNKWNHLVFWGGGGLSSFTQQTCVLSHFCHVQLCVTLWTVAHQAPLSMGFSRWEYWSGLPCSLPGDLPDPEKELASLMSPALTGGFFTTSTT